MTDLPALITLVDDIANHETILDRNQAVENALTELMTARGQFSKTSAEWRDIRGLAEQAIFYYDGGGDDVEKRRESFRQDWAYENKREFNKAMVRFSNGVKSRIDKTSVYVESIERNVVTLEDINDRFGILRGQGSDVVFVDRKTSRAVTKDTVMTELASSVVSIENENGGVKFLNAFDAWYKWKNRRCFSKIVFTNKPVSDDALNLFNGFGLKASPGTTTNIHAHIREIICGGDENAYLAMIKLLAWQLQNIGEPSRVVVVLRSEKHQVGKSIFTDALLLPILGPCGFGAATIDQVLGKFNAAIVGRVIIVMDEVVFYGDRRSADQIKSLATTKSRAIEGKNKPIVETPVAVNLWLTTNHEAAASIEEHDRRYWVLECSDQRVGDRAYFEALMTEIEGGGREAFLHELLELDVSGFKPQHDVPMNNRAKKVMQAFSTNPLDFTRFIIERAELGDSLSERDFMNNGGNPWTKDGQCTLTDINNRYVEWTRNRRSNRGDITPYGSLGAILGKAGFKTIRVRAGNGSRPIMYVYPDPDTALIRLRGYGRAAEEADDEEAEPLINTSAAAVAPITRPVAVPPSDSTLFEDAS